LISAFQLGIEQRWHGTVSIENCPFLRSTRSGIADAERINPKSPHNTGIYSPAIQF
jgi:hypothetical protein